METTEKKQVEIVKSIKGRCKRCGNFADLYENQNQELVCIDCLMKEKKQKKEKNYDDD